MTFADATFNKINLSVSIIQDALHICVEQILHDLNQHLKFILTFFLVFQWIVTNHQSFIDYSYRS